MASLHPETREQGGPAPPEALLLIQQEGILAVLPRGAAVRPRAAGGALRALRRAATVQAAPAAAGKLFR